MELMKYNIRWRGPHLTAVMSSGLKPCTPEKLWQCACFLTLALALLVSDKKAHADEWTQFRGPHGSGTHPTANLPVTFSETENLKWKTRLPGAGSSSPIVLNDRVYVTCYSGYGKANGGRTELGSLKRHVLSIDRTSGKILWEQSVAAELPEDNEQGYLAEHGYASNTPTTDGERLYVFLGKSGVHAFDLDGKPLWKTSVGKESSNKHWGSAASLILHENKLIVNASEESQSLRALEKTTGKELWKAAASGLELAYGTPAIVTPSGQRSEMVIGVPGEVWGMNLDTGKVRWHATTPLTGNVCPSVITNGEMAYLFGGFRSSGSLALRVGGAGDVTKSIVWSGKLSSYVATPLLFQDRLYWVDDRGQAYCISAKTGELIYRERVAGLDGGGRPVYASPVLANNHLYVVTRWNGVLVLSPSTKYQLVAQNKFPKDDSDFNATPALTQNEMFLRSNQYLYCIAKSN